MSEDECCLFPGGAERLQQCQVVLWRLFFIIIPLVSGIALVLLGQNDCVLNIGGDSQRCGRNRGMILCGGFLIALFGLISVTQLQLYVAERRAVGAEEKHVAATEAATGHVSIVLPNMLHDIAAGQATVAKQCSATSLPNAPFPVTMAVHVRPIDVHTLSIPDTKPVQHHTHCLTHPIPA